MEDELNVKLFRRNSRIVELTPEGRSFISDAKNMVGIAEQAKKRFSDSAERKTDTISIGLSNYAQFDSLAEILNILSKEFPNLHPKLHIVPHEQLFHMLKTGGVDIFFGTKEIGKSQDKPKYHELALSSLVGICRSDDPLAQEKEIILDRLKKENLIFSDPFALSADIAKLQIQLALDKDTADIHVCTSAASTFILASAGLGAALVP